MGSYDFRSLSSYDFEILSRDLLQKELELTLESFKAGRDGGVDLRYSQDKSREFIIQCKHYAVSGYEKLRSHLKNTELPKVKRLNPKRYLLTLSVPLSSTNKNEIIKIFEPYIQTTSDIYGLEDLNNLLSKFPEIEKQHFKLWLTSSSILERISHSEVFAQTKIELDAITKRIRIYVQNSSFEKARQILSEHNHCIISGIPGIGKTTLAEMLLVYYLGKDFEVIKISESISEAHKVFKIEQKQIFYYDDFLGQTFLGDKFKKNEDELLLRFFDQIKNSETHKFILTTREYILIQAKRDYERLANSNLDIIKQVLNLSDYSKFDRAKILFNHLYFSELDEGRISNLLENKNYLKIIAHPNFSPRIIETMTKMAHISEVAAKDYFSFFIANLNNPGRIWQYTFEKSISKAGQILNLTLATMPPGSHIDDLQQGFDSLFHALALKYGWPRTQYDFRDALKESEGTFLTIHRKSGVQLVQFHNPSISDFLENQILENPILSAELCEHAAFFSQISRVESILSAERPDKTKSTVFGKKSEIFTRALTLIGRADVRSGDYAHRRGGTFEGDLLFLIVNIRELADPEILKFLETLLSKLLERIETRASDRKLLLKCLRALHKEPSKCLGKKDDLLKRSATFYMANLDSYEDFETLSDFNLYFSEYLPDEELIEVAEKFEEVIYSEFKDWIRDIGDPAELRNIAEELDVLASRFSLDVSTTLEQINDVANEIEEKASDQDFDDERFSEGGDSGPLGVSEDDKISELFDSFELSSSEEK